jgi:hypothetical protein
MTPRRPAPDGGLPLGPALETFARDVHERIHKNDPPHVPTVLEDANAIVYGRGEQEYGHPYDNFSHIAGMWTAYKGVEFTPEDVAAFMILVKMSREQYYPQRDNNVDMAGYAGTWDRVKQERGRRGEGYNDSGA